MTTEEIKKLKEDPKILFFYRIPNSRYEEGYMYVIIGEEKNPFERYGNVVYYQLNKWMTMVLEGSPLAICCEELSRKYKLKEWIRFTRQNEISNALFRSYFQNRGVNILNYIELFYADQLLTEGKVNRPDPFQKGFDIEKLQDNYYGFFTKHGWDKPSVIETISIKSDGY